MARMFIRNDKLISPKKQMLEQRQAEAKITEEKTRKTAKRHRNIRISNYVLLGLNIISLIYLYFNK